MARTGLAGTDGAVRLGFHGTGNGRRCGRAAFAPLLVLMWVALVYGAVTLFGVGGDRPLAIVLLIAALAFLKRLFGFGGRRGGGPRGPKGPRRGPRGPRF